MRVLGFAMVCMPPRNTHSARRWLCISLSELELLNFLGLLEEWYRVHVSPEIMFENATHFAPRTLWTKSEATPSQIIPSLTIMEGTLRRSCHTTCMADWATSATAVRCTTCHMYATFTQYNAQHPTWMQLHWQLFARSTLRIWKLLVSSSLMLWLLVRYNLETWNHSNSNP